jgi:hypothetical protein
LGSVATFEVLQVAWLDMLAKIGCPVMAAEATDLMFLAGRFDDQDVCLDPIIRRHASHEGCF